MNTKIDFRLETFERCVLAVLVTFPLVFGWIHFETIPGNLDWYRSYVFGFPGMAFPMEKAG